MGVIVKASLGLTILVAVLSLGIAFSGLQESNPMVGGLAFIALAILFNVGCVFWGLKQSATQNGYLRQLLAAAGIGLLAGVLIFCFSFLMLTVLMPDHLEEVKGGTIDWLESMDMPEKVLEAQVAKVEAKTAAGESLAGLIGTFFTSLIAGAIVGIFLRKK